MTMRISAVLVALLVSGTALAGGSRRPRPRPEPHAPREPQMPVSVKGYEISGSEYWIWEGDEVNGPEFSFEAGSAAAQACVHTAYEGLKNFLERSADRLQLEGVSTNRFFLWINDLQRATPGTERHTRVWHWPRAAERTSHFDGYMKFEAVVDANGHCSFPSDEKILAYARGERDLIEGQEH